MESKITLKNQIKNKFCSFFGGVSEYFIKHPRAIAVALYGGISLFILALFAILMAIYGVYPFGKATVSSYDMSAQIAPFIEHFFDVIEGRASLFYSYAIAGGADVFGTLAYCCVSPFTFIFLFFGKGNVYYGTGIVLPLKIVCVAISALYYIRKRFPQIHPVMQFILALSYAFCGYLFVSNTYINWVDLLIYLPFVALGFKNLIDGAKKWAFAIPLALMIYTCFSIACFSLFLVFPIIVGYVIFVLDKSQGRKALVNAIWGLVLAIALALPILVPALRAFLVSGRKTGIFENLNASFSETAIYKKTSYLFTDGVTLFFTLAYFVKNGLKSGKDKFLAFAGILLLVPVFIDESMNLLNFGSYMSYSLRFGFLNGFYFFFVACEFVKEFSSDLKATSNDKVLLKNNLIFGSVIVTLCIAILVGFVFLFDAFEKQTISKWFASRFAHSEGGLEGTAIIFGCIALIALFGGLLVNYKKISVHVLVASILILTCGQTTFYSASMVSGNLYTPTKFEQIGVLTNYAKQIEKGNYTRIKMNGDYLTSDMSLTLHTNAYSVFSSVIDNRNFVAPAFFNFGGNGKNQIRSYNGKLIGDAILGNKYAIFSDKSGSANKYLTEVEGYDHLVDVNGNKLDHGEYYLYEYKYALPHAYAVKNAKSSIDGTGLHVDYDNLLKMLGGEEMGITLSEFEVTEVLKDQTGGPVYRIKVYLSVPGNYYLVTNFDNVADIKYTRSVYKEEDAKPLSSNSEMSLGHTYSNYTSKGATYSAYIKSYGEPLTKELVEKSCVAFVVPDSAIQSLYEMASQQTVEFYTEANLIYAKLNANNGEYLFLNYVSLPGHKAYVNGVETPIEDNLLNFMLIKLQEGENEVKIVYKSPYIALIGIGACLGLAIIGVYLLLEYKARKVMNALEPIIYWAGMLLCALVVGFYFVMPTCVFVYKNLTLLVKKIIAIF